MLLAGWNIDSQEVVVIAVVILGLFVFEAGPKVLNLIKKKRDIKRGP